MHESFQSGLEKVLENVPQGVILHWMRNNVIYTNRSFPFLILMNLSSQAKHTYFLSLIYYNLEKNTTEVFEDVIFHTAQ